MHDSSIVVHVNHSGTNSLAMWFTIITRGLCLGYLGLLLCPELLSLRRKLREVWHESLQPVSCERPEGSLVPQLPRLGSRQTVLHLHNCQRMEDCRFPDLQEELARDDGQSNHRPITQIVGFRCYVKQHDRRIPRCAPLLPLSSFWLPSARLGKLESTIKSIISAANMAAEVQVADVNVPVTIQEHFTAPI